MKKKYNLLILAVCICLLSAGSAFAGNNITALREAGAAPMDVYNNPYGNAKITPAQAKKIALSRVPGATEANIVKLQLDYEHGRLVYEGNMYFKNVEYEFDIDANTGDIVKWEMEMKDILD